MHHPAAAEIIVESEGFRLTLRVESSLEDYQRTFEGHLPADVAHEFGGLLHGSLSGSLPALQQVRDQVSANLSQSYTALLEKQIAMLQPARSPRKKRR